MIKGKNPRQITFRIDPKLWEEFSIKAIKKDKSKTAILIEMIKEFLKN